MQLINDNTVFQPGSLVCLRDRNWVVLPSNDPELLLIKPLDGSDDEVTGIFLPFQFEEDMVSSVEFPVPVREDLGAFSSARFLYNASRLSLRHSSGPFRSMGKLSFRPRPYQMVPLIMALKQGNPIRLLIADDVGVGKTIEALIILKELLERKEISRFAIIVLPHLCDQWQAELKDKFGIDAVIIRTNTQAALDREIPDDTSVFMYYPFQVISIDYIKSSSRREVFIQDCPELVIVDEAHSCVDSGPANPSQQQRHKLIEDIITFKPDRNLILLTATPHSGKAEQFHSLLGLLGKEYELVDLRNSTQQQKRELAKYFVQRKRADVEKWSGSDTPFPRRDSGEIEYDLSSRYSEFYYNIRKFVLGLAERGDFKVSRARMRYWAALSLLRGVMSSPAAGVEMLRNKHSRLLESQQEKNTSSIEDQSHDTTPNPLFEVDGVSHEFVESSVLEQTAWSDSERRTLNELAVELEGLKGFEFDIKLHKAVLLVKEWVEAGFNPVVFCHFIETANYVGERMKQELVKSASDIRVETITGESPDDVRKERIENLKEVKRKVLVVTDCLSEGVNLQDQFSAVLHYDMPWNPNRLEQREGRIDRYGQQAPIVKAYLLYSSRNPIDKIVFQVLLKKVREIRDTIGISIPFPEDNQSFMDAILQEVVSQKDILGAAVQKSFDFGEHDPLMQKRLIATKAIEEAADREKISRSIFAQNAIKADEIEQDLIESDKSIGIPEDVEEFMTLSLAELAGVSFVKDRKRNGFEMNLVNLPYELKAALPDRIDKGEKRNRNNVRVSFFSPTPDGFVYIGRNHPFVESWCRSVLARAMAGGDGDSSFRFKVPRASVVKTADVMKKTVLLVFRVRNLIAEKDKPNGIRLVAEEMLVWGYCGEISQKDVLDEKEVERLIKGVSSAEALSVEKQGDVLEVELGRIKGAKGILDAVAYDRANRLVEAHERFRSVIRGRQYKVVEPVLPMDIIGIYILLAAEGMDEKELHKT